MTFNSQRKVLFNEVAVLSVSQVWNYALATALGAQASDYDLSQTEVQVFVLDQTSGSATEDFYIEADNSVLAGFTPEGLVRVVNQSACSLTLRIRVVVRHKPLTVPPPDGGGAGATLYQEWTPSWLYACHFLILL